MSDVYCYRWISKPRNTLEYWFCLEEDVTYDSDIKMFEVENCFVKNVILKYPEFNKERLDLF